MSRRISVFGVIVLLVLALASQMNLAQSGVGTISGTVYDESGLYPVPQVNVWLDGYGVTACTDVNGNYTLDVPMTGAFLVLAGGLNTCGLSAEDEWWPESPDSSGGEFVYIYSAQPDVTGIDFTVYVNIEGEPRITPTEPLPTAVNTETPTPTHTPNPDDEGLPENFALVSPANGIMMRSGLDSVAMQWGMSENAESYTLYVLKVSDNSRIGQVIEQTIDTNACDATGCTVAADLSSFGDGMYSWTVVANNTKGKVEASNGSFMLRVQTGSVELLENGSFETQAAASNAPADWGLSNASKDKLKCNKILEDGTVKIKAYEGNCAFMFKGSVGERSKLKQVQNVGDMNIGPADTLTFSGAFKGNKESVNGVIKVQVRYTDLSIPNSKQNVRFDLTTGYEAFTPLIFTPEGDVSKVKVVIKHTSPTGKVFVDGLSLILNESAVLTPIDDGLLPPPEFKGR